VDQEIVEAGGNTKKISADTSEETIANPIMKQEAAPTAAETADPKEEASTKGTWVQQVSGGKYLYHLINQDTMFWANGNTTILERDTQNQMKIVMQHQGQRTSATLSADGNFLEWSDGERWKRAGLDGAWKGAMSGCIHLISGSSLWNYGKKQQSTTSKEMTWISESAFSVEEGGQRFTAEMDSLGQKLVWSDDDVWTRIAQPNFVIEVRNNMV
jgi:hypothetical protein